MSKRNDRALMRLAGLYGVQTSYEDVAHEEQHATPETLLRTLQALGAPLETVADAPTALNARTETLAGDGIEPVLVAWSGRLTAVPLRLDESTGRQTVRYTVRMEDGDVRTGDARPEPVPRKRSKPGSPTHRISIGGTLPLGYHDLEIETANDVLRSRIIAAPRRAYTPPGQSEWGVFMPLYAVRGVDDWGVGSYTDLEQLARWTGARGGSFVGTLPLLASYLDVCFEPSPYAPVSRLFWNELFIDVTRAPGWSPHLMASIDRKDVDGSAPVNYRTVGHVKLQALRAAAEHYFASGDTDGLDRFVEGRRNVRDYARFRAVLDRRRESWHTWPERLRNGDIEESDYVPADERYHMYAQWVADTQLDAIASASRSDSAALYLDLPLGVSADGYDAWREQALFAQNASTGAPPDALFTGGQDWGFRPPNPLAQRQSGHRYFIECIRHHLRHASMLRLDHVMSLHRLYWIPSGLDATQGAYVRYPDDELFAVIALESVRHSAAIVGEDLGTVPKEVRSLMEKRRVLRMYVVQYELSGDSEDTIAEVPRDVVASVNTHDMPTLRGFVQGSELKDQLALDLVDQREYEHSMEARSRLVQRLAHRFDDAQNSKQLLNRLLAYLAESPARAVLINLEDLWLEPEPQNVPGTNTERLNWRRRSRLTLQEITNSPEITEILDAIDRSRADTHARIGEGRDI